ncbi:MAG: hypothetical protein M3295_05260 [Chloroflexota bacterium]|nr:hypothetical protein [Chloroflexota bacterium]
MAKPVLADPPGNNGTVKIDGEPLEQGHGPGLEDPSPDNEPHITNCFAVEWYGYDAGDLWSSVTFQIWPPTGNGDTLTPEIVDFRDPTDGHEAFDEAGNVYIGEDDNSGAGSNAGIDAAIIYDLSDALAAYEPEPDQQGWHVKLTINADGSQGADVKHKVFWVNGPCATETTPPTGATTPPPSGGTTPPTNSPPPSGGGSVLGNTSPVRSQVPNTSTALTIGGLPLVTVLAGLLLVTSLGALFVPNLVRRMTDR